jgi:hypothetical protein
VISLATLPPIRIEGLPIPQDIEPDDSWPASMLAMAEHIGPYATMLVADRFGGLDLYMPQDPARSPVSAVIGPEKAGILCRMYQREGLPVPAAAQALRRARQRDLLRAVRDRKVSLTEAAYVLRTSRRYLLKLVEDCPPAACS